MLVCGDRNWLDRRHPDGTFNEAFAYWMRDKTFEALLILSKRFEADTIIEGCARGADRAAEDFAERYPLLIRNLEHYPAQWDKYRPTTPGKKNPAGPIRNRQMLTDGKPDFVVAFHDDLENSRGTRDMVEISRSAGIPVYLYTTDMLLERAFRDADR